MTASQPEIKKLKTRLDEYGFVVVERLLDSDLTQQIAGCMNRLFDERAAADEPNQHLRGLLELAPASELPALEAALLDPTCVGLAESVLGDDFRLAEVGARRFHPGAVGLPLHVGVPADRFIRRGLPAPEQCLVLTVSWLLDDVTRGNGARAFLPCSHLARRGPRPDALYDYLAYVEAPAGSAILFNSAVWHAVEPYADSSGSRCELASAYVIPWLDHDELGWKTPPGPVLNQLSPRLRQLHLRPAERKE